MATGYKRKRSNSRTCDENSNRANHDSVDSRVAPPAGTTAPEHAEFTRWSISRGVEINKVGPRCIPGRGVGLVATERIRAGERILFVPGKAIFTPDAAFLSRENLRRASPQVQLAISAIQAFEAPDSKYSVWRATWPSQGSLEQSMPMCWPERLRALLPPTVDQLLTRVVADHSRDWAAVEALCHERGWSFGLFRYYWMIVNSRSFHWAKNASRPGGMVMCPFIDYMNHGPMGTGCNVFETPRGYEVVADRDYELLATYGAHSNDKLLVHYGFVPGPGPESGLGPGPGPSCNTDILDDSISLDPLILARLPEQTKIQLRDLGYLGGYTLMLMSAARSTSTENAPCTPEICFRTQVAVRAALSFTRKEWEYFAGTGEDLGGVDRTGEVDVFVADLLAGLKERGVEVVADLHGRDAVNSRFTDAEDVGDVSTSRSPAERNELLEVATCSILARWKQIIDAVEQFETRRSAATDDTGVTTT